jgi:hypothetical protein
MENGPGRDTSTNREASLLLRGIAKTFTNLAAQSAQLLFLFGDIRHGDYCSFDFIFFRPYQ